jgi:hypothetical protein
MSELPMMVLVFTEKLNTDDSMTYRSYSLDRQEACMCGRSLVWSRTSACHADDPGSNLGDRTKPLFLTVIKLQFYFEERHAGEKLLFPLMPLSEKM